MSGALMQFDERKRDRLRSEYHEAVKANRETFVFEGHELLVSYAKYMIEYLDMKFANGNPSK